MWWIHDEADRCLTLPAWTNRPVELAIMSWVKNKARMGSHAAGAWRQGTTQQQARHDAWLGKPPCDVLLDLDLQTQATHAKNGSHHAEFSITMVPDELRILCRNAWQPLFIRQYVACETHPVTLVVPGCVQMKRRRRREEADAAVEQDVPGVPLHDPAVCGGPKQKHHNEEYKHISLESPGVRMQRYPPPGLPTKFQVWDSPKW
ncbi:unnamed protein product [Symbiodinium microadriaticum]|nr:unnamed protein product [Symbiodinium microadriaticum]